MANRKHVKVGAAAGGQTATGTGLDDFETLSVQIYRILRGEIIMGQLRPGARLVRRALSARFGVSPVPVTEALFRLEQDGLVESEPMFGARVKPMTVEAVRNDQILREAIECQAARLCAENASETEFKELGAKAATLDTLVQRGEPRSRKGMEMHFDFHMAIARLARCAALEQALERVWFRRLMQIGWIQSALFRPPKDWHTTLVDALRSRDPDRAESAMRHHVRYNNDKYLAAMARMGARVRPA